jgi:serine/threonine-protein kinase
LKSGSSPPFGPRRGHTVTPLAVDFAIAGVGPANSMGGGREAHMSEPIGTVQDAERRVGTLLKGKWKLDRLIGVGGMAAVYAATHRNGKRVAVKMLHASLSAHEDMRARFLREGYLANKVGHDGAVSVLDDEVAEDGSVFLVMDLLEGETLDARWERKGRALPASEVLGFADALLDVLGAAHDKGIVHRDIKPENLFLTRAGAIKALDFGIARLREVSGPKETQTGTTMGTPAFMPPEQARGRIEEIDARADVWTVGALMFTLLVGRHVHEGHTSNEVLLSAMTRAAPPVLSLAPSLDPRVAHVGAILKCAIGNCAATMTTLASGQYNPYGLAIDGANVYWIAVGNGTTVRGSVLKCAIGGCGGAPTAIATNLDRPQTLAIDGSYVYWTDAADGAIFKCPLTGCVGAPTTVASGQTSPLGIAVDGASLYWTNYAGTSGQVMTCAK